MSAEGATAGPACAHTRVPARGGLPEGCYDAVPREAILAFRRTTAADDCFSRLVGACGGKAGMRHVEIVFRLSCGQNRGNAERQECVVEVLGNLRGRESLEHGPAAEHFVAFTVYSTVGYARQLAVLQPAERSNAALWHTIPVAGPGKANTLRNLWNETLQCVRLGNEDANVRLGAEAGLDLVAAAGDARAKARHYPALNARARKIDQENECGGPLGLLCRALAYCTQAADDPRDGMYANRAMFCNNSGIGLRWPFGKEARSGRCVVCCLWFTGRPCYCVGASSPAEEDEAEEAEVRALLPTGVPSRMPLTYRRRPTTCAQMVYVLLFNSRALTRGMFEQDRYHEALARVTPNELFEWVQAARPAGLQQ